MISEELLRIIACPKCKGDLKLSEDGNFLICERCKIKYPIEDDIPILIVDEAKPLND
ncbi:Trm112 family protein [Hippea sp. KM1]|uniref:Trm112 family protein n=1 Tax=Hippea sp. KM1 TaxID=944481 RepID=UPI0004AE7C5A|nr:Trm112 family protein [Hippea sp. KM1]